MNCLDQVDKRDAEQGFTLVEMLVVLAVIGLMSGLMLVMMGQFRSIIRVDNSVSEQAALQKTANYIAAQLEQAEVLPLSSIEDGRVEFIQSPGNTIRFSAVSNRAEPGSGLLEYSYAIEDNNGVSELVEQRRPRRNNTSSNSPNKIILLENVNRLSFSFLQTGSTDSEPNWVPKWQDRPDLPEAVRIEIEKWLKPGNKIQASAIAYIGR